MPNCAITCNCSNDTIGIHLSNVSGSTYINIALVIRCLHLWHPYAGVDNGPTIPVLRRSTITGKSGYNIVGIYLSYYIIIIVS